MDQVVKLRVAPSASSRCMLALPSSVMTSATAPSELPSAVTRRTMTIGVSSWSLTHTESAGGKSGLLMMWIPTTLSLVAMRAARGLASSSTRTNLLAATWAGMSPPILLPLKSTPLLPTSLASEHPPPPRPSCFLKLLLQPFGQIALSVGALLLSCERFPQGALGPLRELQAAL